MKPLAIDLFCGLGGWTEGFLAEGWDVVGFDIEQHVYGEHRYPAQLVLQDVCTLHGSQFKDAAIIVASSPCQEFSYRAMPWKRAKALGPPELGMLLFAQAARIQREACEAAGRWIPMIQENVRGAQKYVGRSHWHYGSYHLWGDVPALMPAPHRGVKVPGMSWSGSDKPGYKAVAFNDPRHHSDAVKGVGIGSVSWGQGAGQRHPNDPRNFWSGSIGRKMSAATTAKIPSALSSHIARVLPPRAAGGGLVKPRSEWKQPKRTELPRRTSWIPRGTTPIPKVNVAATKRRTERYAKALRSAHWKALRKQVYAEQGGLCVCGQEPMTTLDHLRYTRLGHELREDVQGLGKICNERETTSKRANWVSGGRRRG